MAVVTAATATIPEHAAEIDRLLRPGPHTGDLLEEGVIAAASTVARSQGRKLVSNPVARGASIAASLAVNSSPGRAAVGCAGRLRVPGPTLGPASFTVWAAPEKCPDRWRRNLRFVRAIRPAESPARTPP